MTSYIRDIFWGRRRLNARAAEQVRQIDSIKEGREKKGGLNLTTQTIERPDAPPAINRGRGA